MTYREATKNYKRTGAAHATGEPCAAMYASMVPYACGMGEKTAPKFYEHFRNLTDREIHDEFKRLVSDPLSCFDII